MSAQQQVVRDQQGDNSSDQKIVKGGATAFPQMSPRPAPLATWPLFRDWMIANIRGPAIATGVVYLVAPYYFKWAKAFVEAKPGRDISTVVATGVTAVHLATYCSAFALTEFFERTNTFRGYKLVTTNAQASAETRIRTFLEKVVQLIVSYYPIKYFAWSLFSRFGSPRSVNTPLPGVLEVFKTLFMSNVLNLVGFACAHRLFHHGPLYRHIHKKHHQFVNSIAIAAEHANPIEELFANTIPTVAGCVLTGAHPLVLLVWLANRLIQTYEAHSGYCFYGTYLHRIGLTNSESSAFHYSHHLHNRGNFGDPFMDHLFGTMDYWISIGGIEGMVAASRKLRAEEGYPV